MDQFDSVDFIYSTGDIRDQAFSNCIHIVSVDKHWFIADEIPSRTISSSIYALSIIIISNILFVGVPRNSPKTIIHCCDNLSWLTADICVAILAMGVGGMKRGFSSRA